MMGWHLPPTSRLNAYIIYLFVTGSAHSNVYTILNNMREIIQKLSCSALRSPKITLVFMVAESTKSTKAGKICLV